LLNTDNASNTEATNGTATDSDVAGADAPNDTTATVDAAPNGNLSSGGNAPIDEAVDATATPAPAGPLDNAEAAVREVRDRAQPELNDALSPALGDANADGQPRKEVADGRSYEIIYIVRVGDDNAAEQTTSRLRAQIESSGGAVDNVRVSETRRLAYPIKKQIEGIYVVVNARFATGIITELDRFFKLEEAVLRHMIQKEGT
jgi:small subunit ribosomal protein S6